MKQELHNEPNLFGPDMPGRTAQQTGVTRTGAKAPKETPPNNDGAVKQQIIPLKDPPWNEWLRLARQGDKNAIRLFCAQAEPFIEQLCSVGVYAFHVGKEEARSIAHLILMEFLMNYPKPPEDKEMLFVLKRIMRNKLIDQIRKLEVKGRYELGITALEGTNGNGTEEGITELLNAKRKEEPEAKLLAKELHNATEDAMQQLLPNEQNVIRAMFFRNKTMSAIAKELQCTRQNVEQMRDRALRRLRQLLEGQHICGCGA